MATAVILPSYVPDPECAIATTASGYIAHRCTGQLRDTAANNILLQWPIDTDTWAWSDDAALYDEFNVRRAQLVDLQMPGDVIGPVTSTAAAATGLPIGETGKNLAAAIAGETHEYTDMYPGMARTAREEGFDEIAEWFETLAKAERSHAGRFQRALNELG